MPGVNAIPKHSADYDYFHGSQYTASHFDGYIKNHLYDRNMFEYDIQKVVDQLDRREIDNAYTKITSLFQRYVLFNGSEADIENNIVQPVIKLLGWDYLSKTNITVQERTFIPDFTLFRSPQQIDIYLTNKEKGTISWDGVISFIEVKKLGVQLDTGKAAIKR